MPNLNVNKSTQDLTATAAFQMHLKDRIAGRYEVRERLGVGGMSTVYLAHDHKNAVDVAIKFMKSDLGGSARRRFFREFNTIAGIQHPCCLRVFEIGETQDAPYFTMELHPGRPVTSVLGDPPNVVAPMLVDLSLAVDYIHSQGIVHRDIKPSNVLAQRTGGKSDGRLSCKLADFGLAKFYQLDSSLTNERGIVGTPAYCAPEQIDGGQIDYRVDLYAIGILAFELLSGGRHPFAAARQQGMNALLHAQLALAPPKLHEVNPNIPHAIGEVVDSYLAKEPDLRPSSALPLRRVLCEEYDIEVDARLAELSSPSEVRLNAVGFVCREKELKLVDAFLQQRIATTGIGSDAGSDVKPLLLFSGEPGTGKTSTMQEAVRRAIGLGYQVYEGRCFDGGATSFQPLIEIVRQILSSHDRTQRNVEESTLLAEYQASNTDLKQMVAVLRDYRAELLLIAPELRRWLGGQAHAPAFYNEPEYLFRAMATMFIELSRINPLCLCFDDVQWADSSTLAFLRHLTAASLQPQTATGDSPSTSTLALVVLCTGRSGYASLESFRARLESQTGLAEIPLASLSLAETRELLALRLGCLPNSITDELTNAIDQLCQGNPFFVSETIREWHQRGMVLRTTDGWQRVHASLDEESSLPSTVRSALRTRLQDLSETAQILIPAAAAIGRVVDLDLLGEVISDVDEASLLDAVDELLSKRIFVESNMASRVAFAHDLLRETVQADLSASRKRTLHRRIAKVLEKQVETQGKHVSEAVLAEHYLAGEMNAEAFDTLLIAGEYAANSFLFEDAIRFLEKAEGIGLGQSDPRSLYRLYYAKTLCGLNLGSLATSEAGQQALRYAETREEKARTYTLLGRHGGVHGSTSTAKENFDLALTVLGLPRPKSRVSQILSINWSLFAFHCLPAPVLAWIYRSKDREEELRIAAEIHYELAHSMALNDIVAYTQICASNVCRSKALADNVAKAVAYAKYGLNLSFAGLSVQLRLMTFGLLGSLGCRYGRLGVRFAEESERQDVLAAVKTSLGFAEYCDGNLIGAEQILLAANKTLQRCRDLHASYCSHYLRHVYSVVGDSAKTIESGAYELALASLIDDTELMGWANYGLTHGYALQGDTAKALTAAEESIRLTEANGSNFCVVSYMEKGFALMQASRYQEAIDEFQTAIGKLFRCFFFFEIAMPTFPRVVEAHLGPNWHHPRHGKDLPAECNPKAARKYARLAWFFSFSFPNIVPHTLRSLGRLNFALGKSQKARKYFESAIAEAKQLGAKYDQARALIDLGTVFADCRRHIEEGFEILDEIGSVIPETERKQIMKRA